MPGTRKLGKPTEARMAMLRQQVTDLLNNGRMETTVTRAKEIAPLPSMQSATAVTPASPASVPVAVTQLKWLLSNSYNCNQPNNK